MVRKRKTTKRDIGSVKVTNTSFQGFHVHFTRRGKSRTEWVSPRSHLVLDKSEISGQIKNLVQRRIFRIEETR